MKSKPYYVLGLLVIVAFYVSLLRTMRQYRALGYAEAKSISNCLSCIPKAASATPADKIGGKADCDNLGPAPSTMRTSDGIRFGCDFQCLRAEATAEGFCVARRGRGMADTR